MYPLHLADATAESVETVFSRFVELQSAWAERFAGLLAEAQEQSGDEPGEDGGDVEDGENDADHKDSDFIIKA